MPSSDPADAYGDLRLSLLGALDEREMEAYIAAAGPPWPEASDAQAYQQLVLARFSAGLAWPTLRDHVRGLVDAFDEPGRVADFDEGDVGRLLDRAGVVEDEPKVRGAIANAMEFRRVTERVGSFAGYIGQYDAPAAALRAVTRPFSGVGPEIGRWFLLRMGHVPTIARDDGVGRVLSRVGIARDRQGPLQSAVRDIARATPDASTRIARVLRTHAGTDENVPDGFDGVGTETPVCGRCRVRDCTGRRHPYEGEP